MPDPVEELVRACEDFIHAYRKQYAKPSTAGLRSNAPMRSEVATLNSALSRFNAERGKGVWVPMEPTRAQLRALLVHRGYDPDADESTLDRLGNLDVMTMGSFVAAYRAMIAAPNMSGKWSLADVGVTPRGPASQTPAAIPETK